MTNYEPRIYTYVEPITGRQVVKAKTNYAGRSVSALAKCDTADTFDLEFGTKVALKRLDIKIAQKRIKTAKRKVGNCQRAIDYLESELKRMRKARENAEILYADRRVELNTYETELDELLKTVYN